MGRKLSLAYKGIAYVVRNNMELNFETKLYIGDVIDNFDICIKKINDIEVAREGCFSDYPLGYNDVLGGVNPDWQVLPQIEHAIETRGEICYLEHQLKKFKEDSSSLNNKNRKELYEFLDNISESLEKTGGISRL